MHNLHGMPGLVGGLVAVIVVPGIARAQLTGIVFTVALAFIAGLVGGYIIKATGSKALVYDDQDEFGEEIPALAPSDKTALASLQE